MDSNDYTHILHRYPSQDTDFLFRAADGVHIGQRQQVTLVFGAEPNKRRSHLFIDAESAFRFMRDRVTAMDIDETGPEIGTDGKPHVQVIDKEAEALIVMPERTMEFPYENRVMSKKFH